MARSTIYPCSAPNLAGCPARLFLRRACPLAELEKVVADMGEAARKAGVKIVTGDTKVVPKGACDKIFINTSGIGEVYASPVPSGHSAKTEDVVLASGTMGDHGLAIMAARSGVSFLSGARSDSAPLNGLARGKFTRQPAACMFCAIPHGGPGHNP